MITTEDAEEFIPLPVSDHAAAERQFIAPAKTFQGKPLFPYSEGVRILLHSAAAGANNTDHWLMILMYLLTELQTRFDRHRAGRPAANGEPAVPAMGEDDATDAAVAELLGAIGENPRLFQGRVIRWAGKLGKKGVAEATALAGQIYEEAQASELVPAEPEVAEAGK